MSNQYNNSGRGGSRRSGRRPYRGGSNRSDSRRDSSTPSRRPDAKKSLWQKILSFFSGGEAVKSNHPSQSKPQEKSRSASPQDRPVRQRPPARKPEAVEVTSPRLYVGNLSFDATESDLSNLFNGVGLVQNVEVVSNKHTQRSKGFAFVQMQTIDEAKRAVEELHDKEYMGRKLVVSGAKELEERRGDRESSDESREPAQETEQ